MALHQYPTPKTEFRDPFSGNISSCQELTLRDVGAGANDVSGHFGAGIHFVRKGDIDETCK